MNFCKEPCEVYGDTVLYLETSATILFAFQQTHGIYKPILFNPLWSLITIPCLIPRAAFKPRNVRASNELVSLSCVSIFKCISINKTHQKKTGFPVQFKLAMLVGKLCWAILSIFLVSTASICFFLRNRLRSRNAHHLSGCLYSIVTCCASDFWIDQETNSANKGFLFGDIPSHLWWVPGFFRLVERCWLDPIRKVCSVWTSNKIQDVHHRS